MDHCMGFVISSPSSGPDLVLVVSELIVMLPARFPNVLSKAPSQGGETADLLVPLAPDYVPMFQLKHLNLVQVMIESLHPKKRRPILIQPRTSTKYDTTRIDAPPRIEIATDVQTR